ncbi:MAG TPA: redoxin domain-containing protein [Pirellulales bacterium]|jgi:hypothetical protein|nr:redoxin domain-containing protein [Pirellulales bacterium]
MVGALSAGDAGSIEDLDGRAAEPMPNERAVAYVFIFTRSDCPISNRYAPEYRRLWEKFHGQGVVFRLVYPDAGDTAKAVRDNLTAFDLPLEAVRDPHHALVHRCGIHTTPEAAVFLGDRQSMVYRGRIDDRFVDFGVARREATTHDLEQAIQTAIDHKSNGLVTTRAVGCTIADAP